MELISKPFLRLEYYGRMLKIPKTYSVVLYSILVTIEYTRYTIDAGKYKERYFVLLYYITVVIPECLLEILKTYSVVLYSILVIIEYTRYTNDAGKYKERYFVLLYLYPSYSFFLYLHVFYDFD